MKAANGVVTTPLQVRREALGTPAQPLPLTANGRVSAEARPALACMKNLTDFPGQISKEFKSNHMTSKFARFLMSTVFAVSVAALAQTAALPAAPSAAASNAAAPAATNATGTRIGTINVEQAIFATNEGQRDFEALSKKLEPKQTELKRPERRSREL